VPLSAARTEPDGGGFLFERPRVAVEPKGSIFVNLSRRTFALGTTAALATAFVPRAARAADELHVAFVPEVATTSASISAKQPFIDWLAKATGRDVKLIVPTNYAATIEAVGNGSVDLAYFGGLAYLKAEAHYGVVPLVQRTEDRAFHALFITNSPDVKTLTDLKGKTFAFGDVISTSGHLIPAKELLEAGVDPTKDLTTRFSGNHTNTALAVNSGQVLAGGLDETVYYAMLKAGTIDATKARVFKTSEPFVDYVWTTSKTLDPAVSAKIKTAFLTLSDPAVLSLLRATKYVVATNTEYDPLRKVAQQLQML
jgi:phosphonate transport system substrate-binding protein